VHFPETGIHRFVARYIRALPDLTGRTVVDVPSGDGRASHLFRQRGATVLALDLFPEFNRAPGVRVRAADMCGRLPLDDACADFLICQEGIEHVPDQLGMLNEFNRVLKPGGFLLLTTPSLSHMRARLSWLLFEADSWRRMPRTELDSVNVADQTGQRLYYGHLFLRGVQHLQSLATLSGFTVVERRRTEVAAGSVVLGLLAWPLLALGSAVSYLTYSRKQKRKIDPRRSGPLWREHVRLNLSPVTLCCKHVFWVLRKEQAPAEKRASLRGIWMPDPS
jgi:SAM-dependent methyltransferase